MMEKIVIASIAFSFWNYYVQLKVKYKHWAVTEEMHCFTPEGAKDNEKNCSRTTMTTSLFSGCKEETKHKNTLFSLFQSI